MTKKLIIHLVGGTTIETGDCFEFTYGFANSEDGTITLRKSFFLDKDDSDQELITIVKDKIIYWEEEKD